MVAMRSPIAERFSPKQPFTVQNVMLSTLSGTEIVVPAKTFDANLVYPESLLRLVQEAKLGPDAIFWFTLVTRDKDNVMYQTVLQATAAQVQPRTNKSRDGGVGLATWVARTMAPLSDDPTPAKVSKPVVVTENTFEMIAHSLEVDCYTQDGGPTRAEAVAAVHSSNQLFDKLGKNPRDGSKNHRVVPMGLMDEGTPAAKRRQTTETPQRSPAPEARASKEKPAVETSPPVVRNRDSTLNATWRRQGVSIPEPRIPTTGGEPRYNRVGDVLVMRQ